MVDNALLKIIKWRVRGVEEYRDRILAIKIRILASFEGSIKSGVHSKILLIWDCVSLHCIFYEILGFTERDQLKKA